VSKDGIKVYDFDLAKAKSLLDDAKFDYTKTVRWLSWNKDARDRQSFIEDCQAGLKTIGVKVEITNGLDVTDKLGRAGTWDLQLYGGYPIQDPDQIRVFTDCKNQGANKLANGYVEGGANVSNYCNPKFDDLMVQASKIGDQAQRAALYEQAQTIWLEDVPIMVTYRKATAYAWNSKLTGVVVFGDPSQAFLKIDLWTKTP
jgi:dipeptide transport system substrate-binding protein